MNTENQSEITQATKDHCAYCFDVLQAALSGDKKSSKGFPPVPDTIPKISAPLFVTWHINKDDLRGCIGIFLTFYNPNLIRNICKTVHREKSS